MWKINHGFTKEIVNFVMYQSGNHLGKKSYKNMEMNFYFFLHFEIQTEISNKNQGDLGEEIKI
jgi:predicted hydrocarbon binding protein